MAYAPDASLGRLVAYLDGRSTTISEAEFRRRLAAQSRRLAETAPPAGGDKKN